MDIAGALERPRCRRIHVEQFITLLHFFHEDLERLLARTKWGFVGGMNEANPETRRPWPKEMYLTRGYLHTHLQGQCSPGQAKERREDFRRKRGSVNSERSNLSASSPYQEGRCELGEWKSDLSAETSQSLMIDCLLLSPGIYGRLERMGR